MLVKENQRLPAAIAAWRSCSGVSVDFPAFAGVPRERCVSLEDVAVDAEGFDMLDDAWEGCGAKKVSRKG